MATALKGIQRDPEILDGATVHRDRVKYTSERTLLVVDGLSLRTPDVGAGVYTRRIIHGLRRYAWSKVRLRVLLPQSIPPYFLPWLPEEQVVRVEEPPRKVPALLRDPWLFDCMVRFVRKRHPDAIFHSPTATWAPHLHRNTIVTLHDCIYRHFPRYMGKRFVRRQLLLAAERYAAGASRVITSSHCSARDLAELANVPRKKIAVIYPWVGFEFKPAEAKAAGPEVARKYGLKSAYWLYVGGYDYRKNIEFLIRAYAAARRKVDCPPLVLAGTIPRDMTKPYCDVYRALRESGLGEEEVVMPGRIPDDDLPALYAQASLFIYPSLYEGFGLPPAEAMAVETPVLVSDSSSLPEVVQNERCRFDPTALGELTGKLAAAAVDPGQFSSLLPAYISEAAGIEAYLELLESLGQRPRGIRVF